MSYIDFSEKTLSSLLSSKPPQPNGFSLNGATLHTPNLVAPSLSITPDMATAVASTCDAAKPQKPKLHINQYVFGYGEIMSVTSVFNLK